MLRAYLHPSRASLVRVAASTCIDGGQLHEGGAHNLINKSIYPSSLQATAALTALCAVLAANPQHLWLINPPQHRLAGHRRADRAVCCARSKSPNISG